MTNSKPFNSFTFLYYNYALLLFFAGTSSESSANPQVTTEMTSPAISTVSQITSSTVESTTSKNDDTSSSTGKYAYK
jgi:hypothetical protein